MIWAPILAELPTCRPLSPYNRAINFKSHNKDASIECETQSVTVQLIELPRRVLEFPGLGLRSQMVFLIASIRNFPQSFQENSGGTSHINPRVTSPTCFDYL
jgi:hypothetical protein